MAKPPGVDNISEASTTLKPRYPRMKLDKYGMRFAKGHRHAWMLTGPRPLFREPKRGS